MMLNDAQDFFLTLFFGLQTSGENWKYDMWELDAASSHRPLSLLAFHLLTKSGLVHSFNLNETKLARFLQRVEDGYKNNPYHNRCILLRVWDEGLGFG